MVPEIRYEDYLFLLSAWWWWLILLRSLLGGGGLSSQHFSFPFSWSKGKRGSGLGWKALGMWGFSWLLVVTGMCTIGLLDRSGDEIGKSVQDMSNCLFQQAISGHLVDTLSWFHLSGVSSDWPLQTYQHEPGKRRVGRSSTCNNLDGKVPSKDWQFRDPGWGT